jgi:uncharacterized membrane protein
MTSPRTAGLLGRSPRQSRPSPKRGWPVPVGLILLSLVPLLAGTFRVIQLLGGPVLIPADHRFAGFPLPLIVHIVGAATYLVVGSFQFVPRFRRRHMGWHRRTGRVLAVAGLMVGGSALWMTLFYAEKPGTGSILYVLRLVFAAAMIAWLVLGVTTVRRHDIAAHRAWMIRAYAIGIAAGTQTLTGGIRTAFFGPSAIVGDVAMGSAWFINLAIAEWIIRRTQSLPAHRDVASQRSSGSASDSLVGKTGGAR